MLKSNFLNNKLGYTFYCSPELDVQPQGLSDSKLIRQKFLVASNENCRSCRKERVRTLGSEGVNDSLQSRKAVRIKKNIRKNSSLKREDRAGILDFNTSARQDSSCFRKGSTLVLESRLKTPYFKPGASGQMNELEDLCRHLKKQNKILKLSMKNQLNIGDEAGISDQSQSNFPAIFKVISSKSKSFFRDQLVSPKSSINSPVLRMENDSFIRMRQEKSSPRPSKYYKDHPITPKLFFKKAFNTK